MKRLAALLFVLLLPGPFRAAPRRATQAECVRSDVRKAPPAERNPDARRERTPERGERYSSQNWPTDDDAAVQRIRREDRRSAVRILFPCTSRDLRNVAGKIEPAAFLGDTDAQYLILFLRNAANDVLRGNQRNIMLTGYAAEQNGYSDFCHVSILLYDL